MLLASDFSVYSFVSLLQKIKHYEVLRTSILSDLFIYPHDRFF